MTSILQPLDISECISSLISRNQLWNGKKVRVFLIANKTAGCFTKKKKAFHYKKLFNKAYKESLSIPECTASIETKVFTTEYAGHAKELAQAIVAELIASNEPETECILISAGGDGTSLEVQTTLFTEAQKEAKKRDVIMNQITILRLPLGTGNDGTDGHKMEETIELLKSNLRFENEQALKVYPENTPTEEQILADGKNPLRYNEDNPSAPWYSFNIASIGVDAYVVFLTNFVKKRIPGNLYHLCIPISGLVYDKEFPTGTANIQLFNKDGEITETLNAPISLTAFGVSGNRVYGGGHKVLPDDRNLCFTPKVKLLTLIKENHRFIDGSFTEINLASLHNAEKIRIDYDKPILLQCDGEPVMLSKAHFPLIMEKSEPCLRVIKKM